VTGRKISRSSERRHKSREQLVRALYQWQLAETPLEALIAQFTASGHRRLDNEHFAHVLRYVLSSAEELDAMIAKHAVRSLDQLDAIGRAVLLVALAELSVCDDVPRKVAINEAVELARRYGATDSYKFVNAVLDKAARELRTDAQ
jgi:N utilization substance protein B